MGLRQSAAVLALVFSVGVSGGFAWRQGWIEFPPPQTGVLDDSHKETESALPSPPPLVATDSAPPETTTELEHFEGLTEPEPTVAVTPDAPARLAPAAPSDLRPVPAPVGNGSQIQSTALQDFASAGAIEQAVATNEPEAVLAEHKELSRIYWREPQRRAEIQGRIDETARLIFFAPQPHFVEPHLVQPGDRLDTVAAKHKLTWEYLSRLNKVDPKRIRAGQRLKLVRGPFSAVVELADYSLTVHLQGYYVKRYTVGIGKDGSSPLGKFPVLNKVVNPQYTDPDGKVIDGDDPQNPLGERWIDLGNSYGIHGTIEPDSIGRAASRGCIRLNDADVVEVYDFLAIGSEVVIR